MVVLSETRGQQNQGYHGTVQKKESLTRCFPRQKGRKISLSSAFLTLSNLSQELPVDCTSPPWNQLIWKPGEKQPTGVSPLWYREEQEKNKGGTLGQIGPGPAILGLLVQGLLLLICEGFFKIVCFGFVLLIFVAVFCSFLIHFCFDMTLILNNFSFLLYIQTSKEHLNYLECHLLYQERYLIETTTFSLTC